MLLSLYSILLAALGTEVFSVLFSQICNADKYVLKWVKNYQACLRARLVAWKLQSEGEKGVCSVTCDVSIFAGRFS